MKEKKNSVGFFLIPGFLREINTHVNERRNRVLEVAPFFFNIHHHHNETRAVQHLQDVLDMLLGISVDTALVL